MPRMRLSNSENLVSEFILAELQSEICCQFTYQPHIKI